MLRSIILCLCYFVLQNTLVSAQQVAGHWQQSDDVEIILTEEGVAKIANTNGIFYGKWTTDNEQITLNLFEEYEPYTYTISDFFDGLTYLGEGHIPHDELAIYRNGYQLDPLPASENQEETGTVSLDTKWLVTPSRLEGAHVATWEMEDGVQLDLSAWGAFRVLSPTNEINYGLFEIKDDIIRLQFLFQDATYEYEMSSIANEKLIGNSTLAPAEFQQAELQMYNQLMAQTQSTNQMLTQMSTQMLEQMHQTTTKMIINLSGSDWMYEDERY